MPYELTKSEEEKLVKTLRTYFPDVDSSESKVAWKHAAPLLAMIVTDRELANKLRSKYHLDLTPLEVATHIDNVCTAFTKKSILTEEKKEEEKGEERKE